MNKDGVVSIGIEYKKEFNQMISDYESTLSEMASNKTISKGMKAQFDNVIAELRSFKAEMDKQLSDLNVGKVDVTKFESFKKSISKKFESINGDISTLNTAVSLLNEKMDMVGNGIDLSKVQNEFKGLEDYINRTNNAVGEFIKSMDMQGIHLFSYDETNQKEIRSAIKMIESELKNLDKDYGAKFELFDEKEAQNELDKLATELKSTMDLLDSAKSRLSGMDASSDIFKKTTGEIAALELKATRLSDTMEILYDTASEKKFFIDITDDKNLAAYDKYIDELSVSLDEVSQSAEKVKKELLSLFGDIKNTNSVQVSDKLNPNSAQLMTGFTIEVDSDELWKKISPVLTDLQRKLNSNPVIAPVKLVVAPTAVSQNNNPDQSISTAYSKKYAKKLAQTGESAIIDMDSVYKKTYTSIMDEAVKCAEESITKIQKIFENTPIDIKLQLSQEELDKINNFVLSNKDEKKIDISDQVDKAKTDVSELNDKLKETTELIWEATQNGSIKFDGVEDFTKQITNSLSSLEKLQDILKALQNVEITLAKVSGISSITEIDNQWESLTKRINNAIKVDGTFRKNANVDKLASEYQKYLDMGGNKELSSISKLKDNETVIDTITSKMKELSSRKIDDSSVEKAVDSFDKFKSSLDDIISRLDHLINLTKNIGNAFYKMFKEASVSDIDKQWSSIESKFKSIADESGKINLSKQKKDVQELMEMYQKYANAGGTKTPFDLTDNTETIKKLNKVYGQLNEAKAQSKSGNKIISDLSEIDESIDSLVNSLENKLPQASNIAATAMEDSAERQVLALASVVDNINMIVEELKKVKGVKIPTIKIDDDSDKKSALSAESNVSSTSTTSVIDDQIKKQNEYNDLVAVGYDRIRKMKKISESGTTGSNSVYDLLRLNHEAWDEVKANNFFNTIPEEGLKRYTKILEVVEKIVQEMVQASGLTEEQIVSQLKNIKTAQGGSFKLNGADSGWTHFATYSNGQKDSMQKVNGITYKVYAAFDDIKDLNQNVVSSIMDELTKAGFKGRLKTTSGSTSFGDKLNGLAITDQMVVHGSTKKDQEIAYNTLKNMGLKLSYLGGGIDTPDGSFSRTLASGEINKYIQGLEKEATVARDTAKAEQQLADARKESSTASIDQKKDAIRVNSSSATNASTSAIKEENSVLQQTSQNAEKAANSKEKFAKANQEVKDSADASVGSIHGENNAFDQNKWDENVKTIQDYMGAVTKLNNLQAKDKDSGKYSSQIELQTKNVEELKQAAYEARANLSSMVNPHDVNIDTWDKWLDVMRQFGQASKGSAESVAKLEDALRDVQNSQISKFEEQRKAYLNKLVGYTDTSKYTSDFINRANDLKDEVVALEFTNPQDIARLQEIDSKIVEINNDSKLLENKLVKQQSKLAEIVSQMKIFKSQNTNMSSSQKAELDQIINYAETMQQSGKEVASEVENIKVKFAGLKAKVNETGKVGKSFFDQIGNRLTDMNSKFIAQFLSWEDWIRYIRQAAQMVIELNTNITELAKVSEQTSKQIYADFDSYADIAKEIGGTISDTISATADWSKNGYSIPDAKQLAEISQLYKNVGDGIDITAANESLISTLKGFQLEADQAEHIVDVFNEVSNNEAISSSGIGEALQRSAASFNAANTSLEQSVALITATNTVLQDVNKTGNMWKTVSARIRGAKAEIEEMGEDTEGMVESTSKLQSLIKGITGVDILESDGKTFKDMYTIVSGIADKWSSLKDIDQAALLEALAGKNQSNALAAALSQPDVLEKAYKEASNAAGSARNEQEEYAKSIQYSIDVTKAKLEELSNDLLSSNFLKGAIDAGSKLIDILDGIVKSGNAIPTVFAAIFAALSIKKNVGRDKTCSLFCHFEYADNTHNLLRIRRFKVCYS